MRRSRRFQVGLMFAFCALSVAVAAAMPDTAHASSPTITSILPSQGTVLGGTAVAITGTDFQSGMTVHIGGFLATAINRTSPTQVTFTTPPASSTLGGSVNVLIQNPDGGVASLASGFYYTAYEIPLAISTVDPRSGPNSGGTNVTLTGTGFSGAAAVYFGDIPASSVNWLGNSAMFARTPPNVNGTAPITVVNPDGAQVTLAEGFTYQGAVRTSAVTPGSGPMAGGTTVTVNGNGFVRGAAVTIGDAAMTSVIVVSSTQIVAVTPKGVQGVARLRVTNPDGAASALDPGFTFGPPANSVLPVISGLIPASGPSHGGTNVAVSGTGFSGGAAVYFGGVLSPSVSWNGASSIFARTPSNVTGPVAVTIVNIDGATATLPNGFTSEGSMGLTLNSLKPTTGPATGGTVVTLTGNGINAGSWVTFDGVPALSSTVVGTTQIVATTPPGLSGTVTIAVTQVGGVTAQMPGAFTLTGGAPAPTPTPAPAVPAAPAGGVGAFLAAPIFSPSGQALVIFGGGSADQLEAAATAAKVTGVWVQDATGAYQLLVVGGPSFLKDQFRSRFAGGLSANTVATLTR